MKQFLGLVCVTAAMAAANLHGYSNVNREDGFVTMAPKNGQQQQQAAQPAFEQGELLHKGKYPAAYNAPAAVKTKNWDCCTFNVNASFIYWHSSQESMDIAYVDPTNLFVFTPEHAVAFAKFEYNPGFQVGIAFNTNYDGWVGSMDYTRLHQETHAHHKAPEVHGVHQVYNNPDWFANAFSTNNTANEVSGEWELEFDMLDTVLGRPFYQGTRLTVSPYGGLRALWIEQELEIKIHGNGQIPSKSENESESWAIGPKVGAGMQWLLGAGFRIVGNVAGSLLYTRYDKISHKESGLIEATRVHDIGGAIHHFSTLRPVLDMGLGLACGYYVYQQKCYLDLAVRYDFMYLWDQNVMRELVSTLQNRVDHVGDLQMHGLTINASIFF